MPADRVSLTEGYQGAQQKNQAVGQEGDNVSGMSKKQHGHTEAFSWPPNKGALAAQAANGSTATANSLAAGSNLHTANAPATASSPAPDRWSRGERRPRPGR